jgi:hypoxanthine phosphoribosyltransferase
VPAFAQLNGLTYVEQAGICLGNDLEPFHVIFRATVTTLFTAERIQKRIIEMAGQMNADYSDGEPLHFVAVLKGAFVFLSDLARAMSPRPVTLDFIAVSSYGAATKSSGEVRLLKDLDTPLQGRDVIIVEDIVDTGLTLNYLQDILRAREPKSLRTACLLSKPSRRKVDVAVEYIGFEIEDKFVVGYGLDDAGQFRHLPFIGIQE